ncbi:MAG TPA: hypothetical protein VG074_02310 [Acidimicrobiales bacterium]|nr:hypothetical protein [Acidimicrobiales bacterium]
MPETTLRGVTLVTKSRRKGDGAFDISISPKGVQILRPGEEARMLEWDRVSTWEMEQRKGSVLLILRGAGSVTPLMIPGWKVHDLDQLLCAMTAHLAPPVDLAVGAPESEREPEVEPGGLEGEAEGDD